MVARGPGAVGCAHCTKLGASAACTVCKHLVCEACAADWATCPEPAGRLVRLGTSGRLIDIDPSGRYGLAHFWHGPLRLLDLRALHWVDEPDLPKPYTGWRDLRPRLTAEPRLVTPRYELFDQVVQFYSLELRRVGGERGTELLERIPPPLRHSGVTAVGDWYYYVTASEQVAIVGAEVSAASVDPPDPAAPVYLRHAPMVERETRVFDPLPRKVLQALHVDAERALIASASWSELAVHRIVGTKLEAVRHVKTTGDVAWVALGGPYVAMQVKAGADRGISVRRVDDGAGVVHAEGGAVAALSRDGRYLAIGHEDGRVVVHATDGGTAVTFDEHTDDVSFVAFAGEDHVLVTADDDNRVIVRPRTDAGYAAGLVETKLVGG